MLNIAVLVSGGGTNLQALLDSEARGENPNGKITLVVASKPGVYALERAAKAGVESCVVRRRDYDNSEDFDAALLGTLKAHNIDLVVLAGFLSVLGPSVIAAYPRRILNVHPALIPSFCGPGMYGLRPHEAALARGCKVTGATVHFVNEECDGGPIIAQKAVPVLPGDTPETLQKRIMEQAEWKLLPEAVALIEKYHDDSRDTLFPMIHYPSMRNHMKALAVLAGIKENLCYHVGRHSFASLVTLEAGVPIETISSMLGHSNIQTTQVYARVTPKKLFEDMDRLIEATGDLKLVL